MQNKARSIKHHGILDRLLGNTELLRDAVVSYYTAIHLNSWVKWECQNEHAKLYNKAVPQGALETTSDINRYLFPN